MKKEFNYIKIEDGIIESGIARLRQISKNTYKYEDNVIKIAEYHNFNGVRVVYASSDSKCQEIIKDGLDEEIDMLMMAYDEL